MDVAVPAWRHLGGRHQGLEVVSFAVASLVDAPAGTRAPAACAATPHAQERGGRAHAAPPAHGGDVRRPAHFIVDTVRADPAQTNLARVGASVTCARRRFKSNVVGIALAESSNNKLSDAERHAAAGTEARSCHGRRH
jgi:hypothetical protein